MMIVQWLKQLNLIENIKILAFKKYFKVLFMKYESTNRLFSPNLIIIIDDYSFKNKANLSSNSNENKEVFIQGMKSSTTVTIGDPYGIRTRVCMRERHVS